MLQRFYFCLFMTVGISMPHLPPYFRGLGLSGREIAAVMSVVPVLNLGLPLLWAWIADRTRQHARVLQVISLGAALGFLTLLGARRFPALLAGYLAYAVFGVGMGGLIDSLAIARVRAGADYGRIRVWGSIGYVVTTIGTGILLTARGAPAADPLVPALVAAALGATFLASLGVRGGGEAAPRPRWADVRALLDDRPYRLLLLVGPLHWMSQAPYNIFFGIFVRDRHLPPVVLGLALALGVIAEMLVLLAFARLRRRFAIETLLAASFAATAIRWALLSQAHGTAAVIALQVMHGLTFGLFWGAAIARVGERVPPALRATGQALLVMSMLGAGNILGYFASGLIYDAAGDAGPAFLAAAGLEILPLVLILHARRRPAAAQTN